jgi:putative Mg2+ transporter-C (MgtC) family protein
MEHWYRIFGPKMDVAAIVSQNIVRLVLAGILGGIIGLEREIKHKPAGLRTNMFICFGSAMFTILSYELASEYAGDHTRIAAQIIPGIGFIGAGSILHSRGSVSGLTTAATLFVVASVGMAIGGGLYLTGVFATFVLLLALFILGRVEAKYELKPLLMNYEVTGDQAEEIITELNRILDVEQQDMAMIRAERVGDHARVQFAIDANRQDHRDLMDQLRQSSVLRSVTLLGARSQE